MSFFTDGAAAGPGKRVDWNTPPEVLARVRRLGPILLDPCSNAGSRVDAAIGLTSGGPVVPWAVAPGGVLFINPPYGRGQVMPFAQKFRDEAS